MKRKNLLIVFSILTLSLLLGCERNSPRNVVKAFSNSIKTFDFEKMDTYIYSENKSEKLPSFEGLDGLEKSFIDYFKENASKISYSIQSVEENNDKAEVIVKYKFLDGGRVIRNSVIEGIKQITPQKILNPNISDDEIEKIFSDIVNIKINEYSEENILEKEITIPCIKINNKWYINGMSEELENVLLSNFVYVIRDIDKVLDIKF